MDTIIEIELAAESKNPPGPLPNPQQMWYTKSRKDGRVDYCGCLENSWVKAPGVRIPLLPCQGNWDLLFFGNVCPFFLSSTVAGGGLIVASLLTVWCCARSYFWALIDSWQYCRMDSCAGVSFRGGLDKYAGRQEPFSGRTVNYCVTHRYVRAV
jgi:hypothetical protein